MLQTRLFALLFFGFLMCCAGCGDGSRGVPVEGTITLDDQPLPGVHVLFDQPERSARENIGYVGLTDESGYYELRPLLGEESGVAPGEYRVSLTTAVVDPNAPAPPPTRASGPYPTETPPPPPERIPPAYLGGKLTFTVPEGGTDAANFELKSK